MKMKSVVLGATLALLAGCITSRSPDCDGYTIQLSHTKVKKSIAYSFLRSTNASAGKEFSETACGPVSKGAWAPPQIESLAISQFRSVFDPLATSINPTAGKSRGDCDILLTIHQQNAYNPTVSIPAFFHGFTLGCLPCWGDDVYYLRVTAERNDGYRQDYLIRRDVSTFSWLPLVVAMPFSSLPATAVNGITMENWKDLRCKMENDGFFDSVAGETKQVTCGPEGQSCDPAKSVIELKKLRDQGLLTQEEYVRALDRIK